MSYFSLDIGSYAIKFVKADGHGSHAKIKTIGSVYNSVGQILPADQHQLEQLAVLIKNGVREFGLTGQNCHLALPANQAYMSIVEMPYLSDAELASAIQWEAEQHLPVNLSEVNFEYDVIFRPEKKTTDASMSVFMVGAPKELINRYVALLEMAGVEPIGLEPDTISLIRSFHSDAKSSAPDSGANTSAATLICNFGALNTGMVIVDKGVLQVMHNAAIGSLALTRSLEKGLGLDPARSEEYKRTYGLNIEQLEGKVRNVLLPVIDGLVKEIRKIQQFYVSKSSGDKIVSRVIITGGGANLPGLPTLLAEMLSVEVVTGNPFGQVTVDSKIKLPEDVDSYAVAVGLALKEF